MSTRAIVRVFEKDKSTNRKFKIDLYHHYDGYIEGVGFELVEMFLNPQTQQLEMPFDVDRVATQIVKKDGYEVTAFNHSDIEYLYEIDVENKNITVYNVNNWGSRMKKKNKISCYTLVHRYLEAKNEILS